jgi:hypothetical protein
MQTNSQQAIEVVHFTSNKEVTDSQLIDAAQNMLSTLQSWDGFIKRELVKVSDKKWIDVVYWKDNKVAMTAQENAMKSEICLAYFSLMTVGEEQMYHGNVVLSHKAKS